VHPSILRDAWSVRQYDRLRSAGPKTTNAALRVYIVGHAQIIRRLLVAIVSSNHDARKLTMPFRALARKSGDKAEPISRRGRSLACAFPEVVHAIATLPHDAVLDAELVVSDLARIERVERVGNWYA
jgi:hypothetical protein